MEPCPGFLRLGDHIRLRRVDNSSALERLDAASSLPLDERFDRKRRGPCANSQHSSTSRVGRSCVQRVTGFDTLKSGEIAFS